MKTFIRPFGLPFGRPLAGVIGGGQSIADMFLSLSPIAYIPCDDGSGTTLRDVTGNNRTLTLRATNTTLSQPGKAGSAVQVAYEANYAISLSAALAGAIDPTEFSVVMVFKPTNLPGSTGIKLYEGWNAALDYCAFECPTTGPLSVLLKEGGVTQSMTLNSILGSLVNNEWVMLTMFNSESAGNSGYYVNKSYRPDVRTLAGFTGPVVVAPGSGIMGFADGLVQHIAFFNNVLSQATVDQIYTRIFGSPAQWSLSYDFDDEFTTDDDAPITSPRTAEPGPGTFNATDTLNKFSILNGELLWSTKTTNNVDPRLISSAAVPWALGQAFIASTTPGGIYLGFDTVATTSPDNHSFLFNAGTLYANTGSGQISLGTIVTNGTVTYRVIVIQRMVGCLFFIKGGVYTSWTLIHVGRTGNPTQYFGVGANAIDVATKVQYCRLDILGSPFNDDYGLATTRMAGKRAALDAFTHSADGTLEFRVVTLPSAGVIDFRFRQQDTDNYWQVTVAADGALGLNEVVATVPTSRGTAAAATIAANDRIFIRMNDARIQVIDQATTGETSRIIYASAANFKTETDGNLAGLGTGGVVGDIVIWPSIVPAGPAAILDAV